MTAKEAIDILSARNMSYTAKYARADRFSRETDEIIQTIVDVNNTAVARKRTLDLARKWLCILEQRPELSEAIVDYIRRMIDSTK